jgi:hypothetical protein
MQVPIKLAGATRTGLGHGVEGVHSTGRVGVTGWDKEKLIVRGGSCVWTDGRLISIPGGGVRLVELLKFLAETARMESY